MSNQNIEKYGTQSECDGDCESCESCEKAGSILATFEKVGLAPIGAAAISPVDLLAFLKPPPPSRGDMPKLSNNVVGNELIITVDLPGVAKETVSVEVPPQDPAALKIGWTRNSEEHRFGYTSVSPEYDATAARATLANGVLSITIPAKPSVTIEVK